MNTHIREQSGINICMKKRLYYIACDILILLISFTLIMVSFSEAMPTSLDTKKAIYHGNTNSKNVSLMINVYWGTEYLEEIMELLLNNGVNATFFVGGSWASMNTDMLMKISVNGFEIGSHGYSHLDHSKLDYETNYEEIKVTHKLIKTFTGKDMTLFAPPSGAYNNVTLKVAEDLGYKVIMWSRDTIDWRDKNTPLIISRATKNIKGGDLILMHPTKNTLEALPEIIRVLKQNYNLVSVSENLFG